MHIAQYEMNPKTKEIGYDLQNLTSERTRKFIHGSKRKILLTISGTFHNLLEIDPDNYFGVKLLKWETGWNSVDTVDMTPITLEDKE